MQNKLRVALIGAGSMGGALLRGWIDKQVIDSARSAVFDPADAPWLRDIVMANRLSLNPETANAGYDACVIAVKPQVAASVLPKFANVAKGAAVISVMAGTSVATIAAALGADARIIRAMPNLASAIGAGISGLYASPTASKNDCDIAERLMRGVGDAVWVDSEDAIDIVTAVSGSGPAYFFLLGEAMAEAARAEGLDADTARRLARATLEGAGAYARSDPRTLEDLRRAVTSPGGTTEAALEIFEGRKLREIVKLAVEAAHRRGGALTR